MLMTDADLARGAGLLSAAGFRRAWAESPDVARFVPPDAGSGEGPALSSAGAQCIDRAIAPGWLALGDALAAFDPLSSAGLTGAVEDALAASEVLVELLGTGNAGRGREVRAAYAARAEASLRGFLAEQSALYSRERRWTGSRFWQRRLPASLPDPGLSRNS